TSASFSFVSCISKTSGCARSSHHVTFCRRAPSEFTFQVAILMTKPASVYRVAFAKRGGIHGGKEALATVDPAGDRGASGGGRRRSLDPAGEGRGQALAGAGGPLVARADVVAGGPGGGPDARHRTRVPAIRHRRAGGGRHLVGVGPLRRDQRAGRTAPSRSEAPHVRGRPGPVRD